MIHDTADDTHLTPNTSLSPSKSSGDADWADADWADAYGCGCCYDGGSHSHSKDAAGVSHGGGDGQEGENGENYEFHVDVSSWLCCRQLTVLPVVP